MASEIIYPDFAETFMKAQQAKNAMMEAQMAPVRMQNEFMNQRINELKFKDAENEYQKRMGREQAVKQFFQPAQPAMTAQPMQTQSQPSFTGNAFAQEMYGQPSVEVPARPARFDSAGYKNALYQTGDVEGAQAVEQDELAKETKTAARAKDMIGIIKDLGAEKFRALQPMLMKLDPNFALIDPNGLQISQRGEVAFPVMTADGKPTGKGVIYDSEGKKQIVDMSTDEKNPTEASLALKASKGDREAQAALDIIAANRKAGRTQINIDTKQETEEGKAVGKFYGEQFGQIQTAGQSAHTTKAKLDQLKSLLARVPTGKGAATFQALKAWGEAFNVKIDESVAPAQAAETLANEMALELRNPSGGAGMPGALSDKDREFLVSMIPNISMTPQGMRMAVDIRKKLAQRNIDVAKLARDYRKKNGTLDEGFGDVMMEFSEKNQLFGGANAPTGGDAGQKEFNVGPYKVRVK